MAEQQKIITPVGRVSYPNVFERKVFETDKKAKPEGWYRITLVFDDPATLKSLKHAATVAMTDLWGDQAEEKRKHSKFHNPFRRNVEKNGKEGFENPEGIFLAFKSDREPAVMKAVKGPDGKWLPCEKKEFYAGCFAKVSCTPFAYERGGGIGVSFWFNNVLKIQDGEPISGSDSDPNVDFADVPESSDLSSVASGAGFDETSDDPF